MGFASSVTSTSGAAAHALADAEEAVAEGMWTPSGPISAELATAHREYDARAARASRHIVPGDDPDAYNALFGDLVALEAYRRSLLEQAVAPTQDAG